MAFSFDQTADNWRLDAYHAGNRSKNKNADRLHSSFDISVLAPLKEGNFIKDYKVDHKGNAYVFFKVDLT